MTLPKGYEGQLGSIKSRRPSGLTRMIVDRRLLVIPFCRIEMVSDSMGKPDKRVDHVEIHPVEWDAKIVFAATKARIRPVGLPITTITDVSVASETKGTFRKKEDLMLKINFRANDNSERWMIINMEDKQVNDFFNQMNILKQKESDEVYWSHRRLTFQDNSGQTRTVDIYPLTPFLAEGEVIVWHNMKSHPNFKNKISMLEVFTNYRVFKYSYDQHVGSVVLLPSIDDITVANLRQSSNIQPVGTYILSSHQLSTSRNVGTVGDITFVSGGKLFLTFSQISDPEQLASSVRLMIQQTSMQIGGQAQRQGVQESPAQPTKTQRISEKVGELVCKKCGTSNPVDSKFCNKCGSSLSLICPNCGNQNASDASFCNKCGSKLSK
jgi:ribosomal protein L40E